MMTPKDIRALEAAARHEVGMETEGSRRAKQILATLDELTGLVEAIVEGAECECPQWTERCESDEHPRPLIRFDIDDPRIAAAAELRKEIGK